MSCDPPAYDETNKDEEVPISSSEPEKDSDLKKAVEKKEELIDIWAYLSGADQTITNLKVSNFTDSMGKWIIKDLSSSICYYLDDCDMNKKYLLDKEGYLLHRNEPKIRIRRVSLSEIQKICGFTYYNRNNKENYFNSERAIEKSLQNSYKEKKEKPEKGSCIIM